MNIDPFGKRLNRRQFLTRSAKAGLSVAAACLIGHRFYDSADPGGAAKISPHTGRLNFAVPDTGGRLGIARGPDRAKTLQLALKSIGGIETYVKTGDRVLLKVNAAFASPPMLSATTHPELVAEISRLCLRAGADEVVVTDNPINDPASCFALTGIAEAAGKAGAKIVLPREYLFNPMTVPGAKLIRNWPVLSKPFKDITKVIGMAPIKDHHRSGASMIMKNWYGLLGGRRNIFHQDIHNIIRDLAIMVTPSLVILDGTTTMLTNGPTGGSLSDLKETNTMIAGTDQVAADAYGATLLGRDLSDLTFIAKAAADGVGTADYRSLNPVEVTL
ncbi:MAG: DUF362 domain-containing protein [Desulfobacterales bacterium]|jgi:uncharacterized protein (DUF362 family)